MCLKASPNFNHKYCGRKHASQFGSLFSAVPFYTIYKPPHATHQNFCRHQKNPLPGVIDAVFPAHPVPWLTQPEEPVPDLLNNTGDRAAGINTC